MGEVKDIETPERVELKPSTPGEVSKFLQGLADTGQIEHYKFKRTFTVRVKWRVFLAGVLCGGVGMLMFLIVMSWIKAPS